VFQFLGQKWIQTSIGLTVWRFGQHLKKRFVCRQQHWPLPYRVKHTKLISFKIRKRGQKDSWINSLDDLIRESGATPNRCTLQCTYLINLMKTHSTRITRHLVLSVAGYLILEIEYSTTSSDIRRGFKIIGRLFTCQALGDYWLGLVPRVPNCEDLDNQKGAHNDSVLR
jgi:hypothetical protein